MYENVDNDLDVVGGELSVRLKLSKYVSLLASWAHREVFNHKTGRASDESPKNLIALGGRFRTESGLVGSLYMFSRSEFWDRYVPNPAGLLEPYYNQHMDNVFLFLGYLGWKWRHEGGPELEMGLKLFLPFSPFSAPYFRYHEKGGVLLATGENYGGDELSRMITGYLRGSF
jgi:hypothetical protein